MTILTADNWQTTSNSNYIKNANLTPKITKKINQACKTKHNKSITNYFFRQPPKGDSAKTPELGRLAAMDQEGELNATHTKEGSI